MKELRKDMLISIDNNWLEYIGNNGYCEIKTKQDIDFIEQLFNLQQNGYIKIIYENLNMMSSSAILFTSIQLTQKGKDIVKSIRKG
ncbi:hypothetical protein OQH61_00440 [Helicobacter sp. MIT 21-1697]|uniref:hypothetical protein n=1 Tax=Helicobacter sp. MIT 21-1697 TaxID=2993733 RepID=UPI00224B44FA|nr:hypothetical protein [Helicobacter sp. MIT 21-1697]MCX2716209.1 hypothetical protein [Helicobacter sp. MIT 21-1697]